MFPAWFQVVFGAFVVLSAGSALAFGVQQLVVAVRDEMDRDERKVAARTERPFSETKGSGK